MENSIEKTEIVGGYSEGVKNAEDYLRSYKFFRRLVTMKKYEKNYFETYMWENDIPAEVSVAMAKMLEIRNSVLGMPGGNEKALLYCHYIKCLPVEKCAELMHISRSSAFRIKKEGIRMFYEYSRSEGNELRTF